jgi:hypothetical protein
MRARNLLWVFLVLGLLAAPATADIIPPVDYHASQTGQDLFSTAWTMYAGTENPTWTTEGEGAAEVYVLHAPNVARPEPAYKKLWLEIDWVSYMPVERLPTEAQFNAVIQVRTASGYTVSEGKWTNNAVGPTSTGEWIITPQPGWEEILISRPVLAEYQAYISRIDVASYCVPEPTTVISLVSGLVALGLVCLRRARR